MNYIRYNIIRSLIHLPGQRFEKLQPLFLVQKLLCPRRAGNFQQGGSLVDGELEGEEIATHPFGLNELCQAIKISVSSLKPVGVAVISVASREDKGFKVCEDRRPSSAMLRRRGLADQGLARSCCHVYNFNSRISQKCFTFLGVYVFTFLRVYVV